MAPSVPIRARHHPWLTVPYAVMAFLVLLLGIAGLQHGVSLESTVFIAIGAANAASGLLAARMPACEYVPTTNGLSRRSFLSFLRRKGPITPGPRRRFAVHDGAIVLAPEGASHGPVVVRRNRVHPHDWGVLAAAVAEANVRTEAGSSALDVDASAEYYREEWRL
ncbi:hypothetical protein [Nocardiopsis chromatogenes]|uniref:hypothetical protein n=1 Tax=Nocardiopsis chromatogenes TaxID=280239 RepID=UPI00037F6408|nr:hypothetical protein [Nocardiopsis chromatogenes]